MGAPWVSLPRQLDRVGRQNFESGINQGLPAVHLKDDHTSEEFGWDTDKHPALATAKGKTAYGTSGTGVTRLLTTYRQDYLVRMAGDTLQWDDNGTWKDIQNFGVANENWDATNFNDKLIIVYGLAPKAWDDSTLSDLSPDAPQGDFITSDDLRVWIAKRDTIHFCAFQDETDWTSAENSGSVQYYTPKGGNITGLYNYNDNIIVFKKNAMGAIYGDNYFNYKLVDVSNQVGCVSHKTIQEVQDVLFWLGEHDVYMYRGGAPIPIGFPIRQYLDALNTEHLEKCFGGTDGIRYYLGIVTGNDTEPNTLLVYDPRVEIWRVNRLGDNFRYSTNLNGVWYVGDADGTTYVMKQSEDDEGTPIDWSVTSKPFDEGIPEAEKEYYQMHLQAKVSTGASIKVEVSVRANDLNDGDDWIEVDNITSNDLIQNKNIIIPLDTVPITHWFRYRLTGSGQVEIYSVERYYRIQPTQH